MMHDYEKPKLLLLLEQLESDPKPRAESKQIQVSERLASIGLAATECLPELRALLRPQPESNIGRAQVAVPYSKHASSCLAKAADDEPVFVLRGQDLVAPSTVRAWAIFAEAAGAKPEKVEEARRVAAAMERWPTRKVPT